MSLSQVEGNISWDFYPQVLNGLLWNLAAGQGAPFTLFDYVHIYMFLMGFVDLKEQDGYREEISKSSH